MTRNDERRVTYLEAGLTIIAGGLIVSFLIWCLSSTSIRDVLFFGFLIWGIAYFFFLFPHFWINVDANTQVILQNHFQKPKEETGDTLDALEIPKGQRVCGAGVSPKRFFEYPVGVPIEITKMQKIEKVVQVRDKYDKPFQVEFQAFLRPISGIYLTHFPLNSDSVAEAFFVGKLSSYLEAKFTEFDGDEILEKLETAMGGLNALLETQFGGDGFVSDDEKILGRTIHNIRVVTIDKEKTAQAAAQVGVMTEQYAEAIAKLVATGVKPDVATAMVASASGLPVDFRIIGFSGAEGLGPLINEFTRGKGGK